MFVNILLFIIAVCVSVSAVQLSWSKQIGSTGYDSGNGVTFDSNGNIYVATYAGGSIDGQSHTGSTGVYNIALLKYSSAGSLEWTRVSASKNGGDAAFAVTYDSLSDEIVVTGYTAGNLDGQIAVGPVDIFVMKYLPNGDKVWTTLLGQADKLTANPSAVGYAIALDSDQNIVMTGAVMGKFTGQTNYGYQDIVTAKFSKDGSFIWVAQTGSYSQDCGRGISTDSVGNVYMVGYASGTINGQSLSPSAYSEILLQKFSPLGKVLWTRLSGPASTSIYQTNWGYAIAMDATTNAPIITGMVTTSITGSLTNELVLRKYDTDGTSLWAVQTESYDKCDLVPLGMTSDKEGNLYITGSANGGFNGQASLGGLDYFVAKYSSTGELLWSQQGGTSGVDQGLAIAVDYASGTVAATGFTAGAFNGSTNAGKSASTDIFTVQYTNI